MDATAELVSGRRAALERMRTAWQDILERYGRLGPREQGDLVDIRTGEVVQDEGHLRSLVHHHEVWCDREKVPRKRGAKHTSVGGPVAGRTALGQSARFFLRLAPASGRRLVGSRHVGQDNLSVSQPCESESEGDAERSLGHYNVRDSNIARDPINILSRHADLRSPSKIRRLRKAIHVSRTRKPNERTRLHQLVRKSPKRASAPPPGARVAKTTPRAHPLHPSLNTLSSSPVARCADDARDLDVVC